MSATHRSLGTAAVKSCASRLGATGSAWPLGSFDESGAWECLAVQRFASSGRLGAARSHALFPRVLPGPADCHRSRYSSHGWCRFQLIVFDSPGGEDCPVGVARHSTHWPTRAVIGISSEWGRWRGDGLCTETACRFPGKVRRRSF